MDVGEGWGGDAAGSGRVSVTVLATIGIGARVSSAGSVSWSVGSADGIVSGSSWVGVGSLKMEIIKYTENTRDSTITAFFCFNQNAITVRKT